MKTMIKNLLLSGLLLMIFSVSAAPNQPFQWTWDLQNNQLNIILFSPDDAYIYAKMTSVKVEHKNKEIQPVSIPQSHEKDDPIMGKTLIYQGRNLWRYSLNAADAPFTVSIAWQGCSTGKDPKKAAVCYLPSKTAKEFQDLTSSAGVLYYGKSTKTESKAISPIAITPIAIAKPEGGFKIERTAFGYLNAAEFIDFMEGKHSTLSFAGKGIFLVILLSILGGIALNLTPCVLPMIPINLAIIGADTGNRKNAVIRGLVYAAGIAIAYGAVGLAAVLGGATFGALDSYWYFNLGVAVVFVLLGLSMFDVFSIDFSRYGSNLKAPSTGHLAGVFFLGAVSALLAGACVAPVVIAVLIHSAGLYASGNHFGLILPFMLGIGMGLPWPIIAAGIASAPKPGKWMVKVKYVFGSIIVLVGFYYAWLGLQLLMADSVSTEKADLHAPEHIEKAFAESRRNGKPVLIDFWAEWCKNCKAMDLTTLRNPEVQEVLKKFNFVKLDATNVSDPKIKAVMEKYDVTGLPTYIIAVPK